MARQPQAGHNLNLSSADFITREPYNIQPEDRDRGSGINMLVIVGVVVGAVVVVIVGDNGSDSDGTNLNIMDGAYDLYKH